MKPCFDLFSSLSARPLLRPGTGVHTDSAQAYRNLGFHDCCHDELPDQELVDVMLQTRPQAWRMESPEETRERLEAEAREEPGRGRTEEWAAKYRCLRLAHTSVLHKHTRSQKKQFVAMRRVQFAEEDAVALMGTDPFLRGTTTWRKGGTQAVDGYWRELRRKVATRGTNTRLTAVMVRAVRVHQWSYWAGPSADLFLLLGGVLRARRERRAADVQAAKKAREEQEEREMASLRGRRRRQVQDDDDGDGGAPEAAAPAGAGVCAVVHKINQYQLLHVMLTCASASLLEVCLHQQVLTSPGLPSEHNLNQVMLHLQVF